MRKFKKKLPKFKNQAEEREFWLTHDSADYIDWSKAENVEFKLNYPSPGATLRPLPQGER